MFTWLSDKTTNRRTRGHSITSAGLFARCNRRQRAELERLSAAFPVAAGTRLSIEGSRRAELVVLLDGTATVSQGGRQTDSLGPGDHFGVATVLPVGHDPAVQPTTIVADDEQWVATMRPAQVRALLSRFPELAPTLYRDAPAPSADGDRADEPTSGEVGGLRHSSAV